MSWPTMATLPAPAFEEASLDCSTSPPAPGEAMAIGTFTLTGTICTVFALASAS